MVLSDKASQEALRAGLIEITPAPIETRYTSSAVDLTLGSQFQGWNSDILRVPGTRVELNLAVQTYPTTAKAYLKSFELENDGSFIFPPYSQEPMVLLAQTQESIHLKRDSGLAARVEGRSSLARIGLTVHLTAPTIHCGFQGRITLELINHSFFYLRMVPGSVICQLIIERVEGAPGEHGLSESSEPFRNLSANSALPIANSLPALPHLRYRTLIPFSAGASP